MSELEFYGTVTEYGGSLQINNATTKAIEPVAQEKSELEIKIKYPTVQGMQGKSLEKLVGLIPKSLWEKIPSGIPDETLKERSLYRVEDAFRIKHGLEKDKIDQDNQKKATTTLAYFEFYQEQMKLKLRRDKVKRLHGNYLEIDEATLKRFGKLFPYDLTKDQAKALVDIQKDFQSGNPMMRLIQGDVGCGKTTVAVLAGLIAIHNKFQSAFMCPTESLALQHYQTLTELLEPIGVGVGLLLGSTKTKERREILEKLASGEIQFIIGTHSLIQDKVIFKNLGFVIIDEQHKFGVKQRIKLTDKGRSKKKGIEYECHCLIMSATPIPRSLSLTQYGDLDITSVKSMPSNRKGIRTKIITPRNFDKFLSFLKTRIDLGEQAYIVVPAIEESENADFQNVQEVYLKFTKFFPQFNTQMLHGKLKSEEKELILNQFVAKKVDILISTTVIEVGINVVNSTIMGIINPERFGLSSLHQLRGRVGRGDKPGFCFLITDRVKTPEVMERLKVVEGTSDGFKIAEADLEIRGEGNLFGTEQSGALIDRKIGNIIINRDQLEWAKEDVDTLVSQNNPVIKATMSKLSNDSQVFSTI
jgi:ATP-dependent DNA helicase RecG